MTTISIAYETPAATVEAVRLMLEETAQRDINWNGADFKIVRDDFTCIEDNDSHAAAALLYRIQGIISGQ